MRDDDAEMARQLSNPDFVQIVEGDHGIFLALPARTSTYAFFYLRVP
jgi:hypothetical protein